MAVFGLLRHGNHTRQPAVSENATSLSAYITRRVRMVSVQMNIFLYWCWSLQHMAAMLYGSSPYGSHEHAEDEELCSRLESALARPGCHGGQGQRSKFCAGQIVEALPLGSSNTVVLRVYHRGGGDGRVSRLTCTARLRPYCLRRVSHGSPLPGWSTGHTDRPTR